MLFEYNLPKRGRASFQACPLTESQASSLGLGLAGSQTGLFHRISIALSYQLR